MKIQFMGFSVELWQIAEVIVYLLVAMVIAGVILLFTPLRWPWSLILIGPLAAAVMGVVGWAVWQKTVDSTWNPFMYGTKGRHSGLLCRRCAHEARRSRDSRLFKSLIYRNSQFSAKAE